MPLRINCLRSLSNAAALCATDIKVVIDKYLFKLLIIIINIVSEIILFEKTTATISITKSSQINAFQLSFLALNEI